MKTKSLSAVVLALGAAFAGQAMAQDLPVTRAQVHEETLQAIRNGDMFDARTEQPLNQVHPAQYQVAQQDVVNSRASYFSGGTSRDGSMQYTDDSAQSSSLTRAQVQAQTLRDIQSGDMLDGRTELPLRVIHPNQYPMVNNHSSFR